MQTVFTVVRQRADWLKYTHTHRTCGRLWLSAALLLAAMLPTACPGIGTISLANTPAILASDWLMDNPRDCGLCRTFGGAPSLEAVFSKSMDRRFTSQSGSAKLQNPSEPNPQFPHTLLQHQQPPKPPISVYFSCKFEDQVWPKTSHVPSLYMAPTWFLTLHLLLLSRCKECPEVRIFGLIPPTTEIQSEFQRFSTILFFCTLSIKWLD